VCDWDIPPAGGEEVCVTKVLQEKMGMVANLVYGLPGLLPFFLSFVCKRRPNIFLKKEASEKRAVIR
jgi:hypothetical protein